MTSPEPAADRAADGAAERAAALADLLAPLAERQRRWTAGEDDDEYEDPAKVWAQPLVVRLERADPPDRIRALEAAAIASLSVLADDRASGEWAEACRTWIAGRIRKVARRARGAHWQAASELPGVTIECEGAQVRAFPPYPVADTPPVLRRLQVGGTELPDLVAPPLPPAEVPVLWLNPHVAMSAGKAMAQVGHGSMLLAAFAGRADLSRWLAAGLRVAVRTADPDRWGQLARGPVDPHERFAERGTVCVRDAGFTEIEPGTITVVASIR